MESKVKSKVNPERRRQRFSGDSRGQVLHSSTSIFRKSVNKAARSIADLKGTDDIGTIPIAEVAQYRWLERRIANQRQ